MKTKKGAAEFGKGCDERNLRHMRAYYTAFPKCDALRHELSWTHYRSLLRVEDANILCAQKDKPVVRYSVLYGNEQQLFAIKYKLVLPDEEELRAELVREQRMLAEQTLDLPGDAEGGQP